MKLLLICVVSMFIISGCAGEPSRTSFPEPPVKLMDRPADLATFSDRKETDIRLSDVTKMVVFNYNTCNLYKEQVFGLQRWIVEQKKINP